MITWHTSGGYTRFSDMVNQGDFLVPILYNLGTVIIFSVLLGLLIEKIVDMLKKKTPDRNNHGNKSS